MFQIFVPDPPQNPAPEKEPIERRKHPRYRYIKEVAICPAGGIEFSATTFEISESGMSAASPNYLNVGDPLKCFPAPIPGSKPSSAAKSAPCTALNSYISPFPKNAS
jgi:hypothetical protein